MSYDFGQFNEYGPLRKVALRNPAQAMQNDLKIDGEWKDLNWHSRPDLENAKQEYRTFEALLTSVGADLIQLPSGNGLTLDALYTRDALVMTPNGIVKPRMGKVQRRKESDSNAAALSALGFPIAGEITGEGKLEGGDLVWLDRHTLLAGIGYRTNLDGVEQLQKLCGDDVRVHWFDMPHYKGTSDVFHLMSTLSPIAEDLAVIYKPLTSARLIEFLASRNIKFVEVPEQEFDTMGCNVLAIAPRHVVCVEGNPETIARMTAAGVRVEVLKANDISRKGEGGPTCLTRPLVRG
jgi:N-dimethylarginine dimethylaminohydrolase